MNKRLGLQMSYSLCYVFTATKHIQKLPWLAFVLLMLGLTTRVAGQVDTAGSGYPAVNESKLLNSRWKYTYTSHAQSNTVIHRADKGYEYYLYLKFDGTLEHYLNGRFFKDAWKLNAAHNELYYNFRQVQWWKIASFSDNQLVLEFSAGKTASYRYFFVRTTEKETPFVRAANELPEVLVETWQTKEATVPKSQQNKKQKKYANGPKQKEFISKPSPIYIRIELVGGGYYGGPNPVYSDFLTIDTDGQLVREIKTEKYGTQKIKKKIGRKTLETLLSFIESKNFFNYKPSYNCNASLCTQRLNKSPRPVPMRLIVTYGNLRKMVSVQIFGKDDQRIKYIDYPDDLDLIVDNIQRMAY